LYVAYYIDSTAKLKLFILITIILNKFTLHNGNKCVPVRQIQYNESLRNDITFTNILKVNRLTTLKFIFSAFHEISYFFFGDIESIELFFYDVSCNFFCFQYIEEVMIILFTVDLKAFYINIFIMINSFDSFKSTLFLGIIYLILIFFWWKMFCDDFI
jgi:hypothetical protein